MFMSPLHLCLFLDVFRSDCVRLVFDSCSAAVLAIRRFGEFVPEVSSGEDCGLILDRTCFYAEAGGQTFDSGYMTKEGDEVGSCVRAKKNRKSLSGILWFQETEFTVKNVQMRGGFIIHMGEVEGTIRVGDTLRLFVDEVRLILAASITGSYGAS